MKKSVFTFEGVEFQIVRRRVKHSRIIYRRRNPLVILPPGISPARLFKAHHAGISRTIRSYREAVREADRLEIGSLEDRDLLPYIRSQVDRYSRNLGVKTGEIKLRKMKRRWGTCYSDGRIILNRAIRHLPYRLISYILYHEVLHMKIRRHNRAFKEAMKLRFGNTVGLDRELKLYGLRLLED